MMRRQPLARLTVVILAAQLSFAAGCGPAPAHKGAAAGAAAGDTALRERDTALLREVDDLARRCASASPHDPQCLEQACRLRFQELALFAAVRAHDFSDITESNYWHRGRLKFPGDLEQLLRRLAEEPRSPGPPCAAAASVAAGPASGR